LLLEWAAAHNALGVITPTVQPHKMLHDLSDGMQYLYEASDAHQDTVAIGNYHLHKSAFVRSTAIIKRAIAQNPSWIVLDEVGKLELRNEGHHELVQYILAKAESNILLVVRDYLLEAVLEKYQIRDYRLVFAADLREEIDLKHRMEKID
jgi:nucleoside-triphosphatase